MHANSVGKDFEIKTLREHCGLYVESDVLLLADVFNNFEFIWLEKNWTWSCTFPFYIRISMRNSLKKHKSKLISIK